MHLVGARCARTDGLCLRESRKLFTLVVDEVEHRHTAQRILPFHLREVLAVPVGGFVVFLLVLQQQDWQLG